MGDVAIMHYAGEAECRRSQSPGTEGYKACLEALKHREFATYRDAAKPW